MNQYTVIMAGGSGTRLWPMSRKAKPKQLHNLVSEKTMIQETYGRIAKTSLTENIFVSTTPKFIDEIKIQLPEISEANFIIEPNAKNTAAALLYITQTIMRKDPKAMIATIASDHIVNNANVFVSIIGNAFRTIKKYPNRLVVVGINPTKPDTSLGYIKIGLLRDKIKGEKVFEVDEFVEKPNLKTAITYVQNQGYLWNSAYYFYKGSELIKWFKKYRPKTSITLKKIDKLEKKDGNSIAQEKIKDLYNSLDNEQFERAIIEQKDFKKVLVISAALDWSDVGNWGTLFDVLSKTHNTKMISRGYHIDIGSSDCLIYGAEKMIATLDLANITVVDTPDVIFIANTNKIQNIENLLTKLKSEGKHLYL